MTEKELAEFESNPLWSDEGQVLWLLDQQGDAAELLTAQQISEQLSVAPSSLSWVLQKLASEGKVRDCVVDRCARWGTNRQVQRWVGQQRSDERQRADEQATYASPHRR